MTAIREAKEELLKSRRTLMTCTEEAEPLRPRRISISVPLIRSSSVPILPQDSRTTGSPCIRSPCDGLDVYDKFDDKHIHTSRSPDLAQENSFLSGRSNILDSPMPFQPEQTDYFAARFKQLKVYEDYSAPVWVPDSRAERCMRCSEAFAVWRRRHHCRLCGDVVCWACSTKVSQLPSRGW